MAVDDTAGSENSPAPLFSPPRLRTGEDRSASRLELFSDLAYVLVVAELTRAFAKDLTWHGAAAFAALFSVSWWSWVTITLYANRFDTNDVPYRLAKLGVVFAVAVMAASAAEATGPDARFFTLGYLATRLLLLVLYVRAHRHVVEARATIAIYATGAAVGAALWASSLIVPAPTRYVLWAVGVLVEAISPLLATRHGQDVPLHQEHLPERFALFVILVLGESITSVVLGMHETEWRVASVATAAVGFVIAAALWWNYFDLGGAVGKQRLLADEGRQSSGIPDRYVYSHLPLILGLAVVGIGIEEYILHPVGELSTGGRWTLCGGTALFLAGTALMVAGTSGRWAAAWPWPVAAIPPILLIGVLDSLLPIISASAIGVAVVVTVLAGIREQRRGQLDTTEA